MQDSAGQLDRFGEVDLGLSRSISAALLLLYCLYVYFQLCTHAHLFEDEEVHAWLHACVYVT